MGSGSWSSSSFETYTRSTGRSYDRTSRTVKGINRNNSFTRSEIHPSLDPKRMNGFRECVNTPEHPNTIPVILALDVTGSMGGACEATVAALGSIVSDLYDRYKDVEIMVMGIGDIECDDAPIQISQFESDIRIAKHLDNIYVEYGGGANNYESYTAAWYMGLYHTKLDCWKQGRKGIIITMGDEPLNPILKSGPLVRALGCSLSVQDERYLVTDELYKAVKEKFDVFHISINDSIAYTNHAPEICESFEMLGERYKSTDIKNLQAVITSCIDDALDGQQFEMSVGETTSMPVIGW